MTNTRRLPSLLLLVAIAAPAQQPLPNPQLSQRPTEPKPLARRPPAATPDARRRIFLDVVVTDSTNKPVLNLEPSDFSILDNHAPQKLLSFRRTQSATADATPQAEPPPEAILVLDSANTSYQEMLFYRQDLEKFLSLNNGKLAQPTSIVLVSDTKMKVQPHPTRDGNALVRELERNHNALHALRRSAGGAADVEKVQLCLRSLAQLAAYEAARPGRKIVIWIGPGWSSLARGEADMTDLDRRHVFDSIVLLSTRLREARITLYDVDAGGSLYYQAFLKPVLSVNKAESPDLMVQVLATQSGGRFINTSNGLADGISNCLSDLAAYYTLSFDAPTTTHPDEYHSLEVRITRPNLTTHTNTGYYNQP